MLRRKKALCAVLTGIIAGMPLLAAAEVSMTASGGNDRIRIHGNLDTQEAKEFVIKVLKGIDTALTEETAADQLIVLEQGKSAADGSYAVDVPVSAATASGDYQIMLTIEGSRSVDKKISFYYLSRAEQDGIIESVNGAKTAAALQKEVLDHQKELNIDTEEIYTALTSSVKVFEKMLTVKEKTAYQSLGEIQQSFRESCAIASVEEGRTAAEILDRLIKYKDILGIDPSLAEELDNPQEVGAHIGGRTYAQAVQLQARFLESVCVSAFNQATRGKMEALLRTYQDQLSLPAAYQSAAKEQKSALYKDLESVRNFDSYDDVSNYIKDWFTGGNTGNAGSGGSSGGSGGGGGGSASGISSGGLSAGMADTSKEHTDQDYTASALTPAAKFTDLETVPWATEAIEYLANQKVIQGVRADAFEPDRAVTREEFVKILVGAFGVSWSGQVTEFADVDAAAWYAPYVFAAAEKGIVQGIDAQHFGIGTEISRQDMAVMLYRTLQILEREPQKNAAVQSFADGSQIAEYAKEAVDALCGYGVMNGVSETEFAPEEHATRAMAAKVIYLLMVKA